MFYDINNNFTLSVKNDNFVIMYINIVKKAID